MKRVAESERRPWESPTGVSAETAAAVTGVMVKRKSSEGQEQESGRGIPLPIQTFLWRQTR